MNKYEIAEKAALDHLKTEKICTLTFGEQSADGSVDWAGTGLSPECAVLEAALYAIKVDVAPGTDRRVIIQDLAASLDRKRFFHNMNDVEKFWVLAEEKMI